VNSRSFSSLLRCTFLLVALAAAASLPALAQEPPPTAEFVPGQILVKFKPGVGGLGARRALAAQSLSVAGDIPSLDVFKVSVKPGQELEQIAALRGDSDVLYAEPNYVAYAVDIIPNDTYYGVQWGLSKIDAPAGWDYTTGDSSVTIAIVDSGIDLNHPDLACPGKLTAARWNFVGNNANPDDDYGHGTHVAGIAAACSNNHTGVAGVAWGAHLMPVKVLNSSGGGDYATVAAGITYAVDHGATVINLSLGGDANSSTLADAIQYAYAHNRLVVAAAGNGGGAVLYPAAYPQVVAVAATNGDDQYYVAYNPGSQLDVAAPGVDVYSTYPANIYNPLWPSCYGRYYCSLTGTSMATSHVSGLAALVWSFDHSLTADQVRAVLQSTADDLGAPGRDDYFGYGRINAARALESISLRVSPAQTFFLADDDSGPLPPSHQIQVVTAGPNTITWTASISPAVAWLSIAPPASGMVSPASPGGLTLEVPIRPAAYGTYTTTVVVTGTGSSGAAIGPATSEVRITYLPRLPRNFLPFISRNIMP
jgi:thermitase